MVRNDSPRFDITSLDVNPQLEEFKSVHSLITSNSCRSNVKVKDFCGVPESSITSTICRTIADFPSVSSTVKAIIAQFSRHACYDTRSLASFGQDYRPSTKPKKLKKNIRSVLDANGQVATNLLLEVTTEQPHGLIQCERTKTLEKSKLPISDAVKSDVKKEKPKRKKSSGLSKLFRHASDPNGCKQEVENSSQVQRSFSDCQGLSKGKTRPRMIPRSNVSQKVMHFEKYCRENNQVSCDSCHSNRAPRRATRVEWPKWWSNQTSSSSNAVISNNHATINDINVPQCTQSGTECAMDVSENSCMHVLPLAKTCQKACSKLLQNSNSQKFEQTNNDDDEFDVEQESELMDTANDVQSENTQISSDNIMQNTKTSDTAQPRGGKRRWGSAIKRTPSDRFQSMRNKLQKLMSPKHGALPIESEELDEEQMKINYLQSIRITSPAHIAKNGGYSRFTDCYIDLLPNEIIAQISSYLDTKSLAMLKCTSSDLKFVIEKYDIRSTDEAWVKHPRYQEDPCKLCRRIRTPGDTTMCRYHPKFYHCGLPYGRSYWMCCYATEKGALGCRTGHHNNNWLS